MYGGHYFLSGTTILVNFSLWYELILDESRGGITTPWKEGFVNKRMGSSTPARPPARQPGCREEGKHFVLWLFPICQELVEAPEKLAPVSIVCSLKLETHFSERKRAWVDEKPKCRWINDYWMKLFIRFKVMILEGLLFEQDIAIWDGRKRLCMNLFLLFDWHLYLERASIYKAHYPLIELVI